MTKLEFFAEYQRLHRQFPDRFMIDNPTKLRGLFELWEPLPVHILKSAIDRVLKNNDPKFDLASVATSELRSRKSYEKSLALIKIPVERTEEGLANALKEFNAKSLLEAVVKSRHKSKT